MPAAKVKHISGWLTQVRSSRVPYKPYDPVLDFAGRVLVELDIPADQVLADEDGVVTIGLDGLNSILSVMADSMDKLDKEHQKKIMKGIN